MLSVKSLVISSYTSISNFLLRHPLNNIVTLSHFMILSDVIAMLL